MRELAFIKDLLFKKQAGFQKSLFNFFSGIGSKKMSSGKTPPMKSKRRKNVELQESCGLELELGVEGLSLLTSLGKCSTLKQEGLIYLMIDSGLSSKSS